MKKFLKAAFKISLWEISVIVAFGALKYILVTYELADKISGPFIWICFGAALLFLTALGVAGIIENKYGSFEKWETETEPTKRRRIIVTFVTWGQLIPIALGALLFIYLIAPTTVIVFVAFIVGIVLRNSIQYFQQRKRETVQEVN